MTYSISLMWLMFAQQEESLLPSSFKYRTREEYYQELANWAKLNTEAEIILWFNGDKVSQAAIDNSKQVLTEIMDKAEFAETNIRFANIWDEKIFASNRELLNAIPPYALIDTTRLMICYIELQRGVEYVIATDFNIEPIGRQELLESDDRIERLQHAGMLLFDFGDRSENAFLLFHQQPEVSLVLQTVINSCLYKYAFYFNEAKDFPQQIDLTRHTRFLYEIPYHATIAAFHNLYDHLKNNRIRMLRQPDSLDKSLRGKQYLTFRMLADDSFASHQLLGNSFYPGSKPTKALSFFANVQEITANQETFIEYVPLYFLLQPVDRAGEKLLEFDHDARHFGTFPGIEGSRGWQMNGRNHHADCNHSLLLAQNDVFVAEPAYLSGATIEMDRFDAAFYGQYLALLTVMVSLLVCTGRFTSLVRRPDDAHHPHRH